MTMGDISVYGTWVTTLRKWAADPTTRLDGLPVLANDTFTPDTYRRFTEHLMQALGRHGERWRDQLQAGFERAAGRPHELARELVDLRTHLARRVELATHPALPDGIRDALERAVRSDIDRCQRELEEAVRRQSAAARVDNAGVEATLRVVRDNPMTGVFGLQIGAGGRRAAARVLPDQIVAGPPAPPRRGHRRVVPIADSPIDVE